jgi:3-keto-5-aminohexanoate cleavage enzyme
MVPKRDRVPHVPVTPEQIVEDGQACFEAGATILHLHARDENEEPEWRREAYEGFIPELRRRCPGVVLCVTTSGRKFVEFEKRSDVLNGGLKPPPHHPRESATR